MQHYRTMPDPPAVTDQERLVVHLLDKGLVGREVLDECLSEQQLALDEGQPPPLLVQLLLRRGLVDAGQLVALLRSQASDDDGPGRPAASAEESATPEHLGKYRITRLLAVGGMGRVYQAVDPELRRLVALKVLRDPDGQTGQSERLQREARIAAGLSHPGIISVQEVGQATDPAGRSFDYIAMEYVDGPTLGEAMTDLALARRLRLLEAVADAVGYAHERGVIHRDLKPANVLLRPVGGPVVTDFGLARADDQTRLTRTGAVMGTTLYMAPEQVNGDHERIGPATDSWALGVMLYEALTNRLPFEGPTTADVFTQILHADPPMFSPAVPPELRTICLKALEKDPRRRYPNGESLRADLERYRLDQPIRARPPSLLYRLRKWTRRHRLLSGLLAGLLLCGASLGVGLPIHRFVRLQRLLTRAGTAAAQARYPEAQEAYALALEIDRGDPRALEGLARVRQAQRRLTLERARAAQAREDVEAARKLLDGKPGIDELERRWRSRRRPDHTMRVESIQEGKDRELALSRLLTCVSRLDRARALTPGDAAALRLRRRAGEALGRVALIGGDYTLARRAFGDLEHHGLSAERVAQLTRRVDDAQSRVLLFRRRRLEKMLTELREGRLTASWTRTDCVFEAVGYRDLQTVEMMREALEPFLARAIKQRRKARFSRTERDVLRFATEVLGRIGMAECAPPLLDLLSVLWDDELIRWTAEAVSNTRQPGTYYALLEIQRRVGRGSQAHGLIRQLLSRVPPPVMDEKPATLRDFVLRAQVHRNQRRYTLAIRDFSAAIALAPKRSDLYVSRGTLYSDLSRPVEAARDLQRAIELAPKEPGPWLALAILRFEQKKREEALRLVRRALVLDNGRPTAWLLASRCYLTIGNLEQAMMCAENAVVLGESMASAHLQLGLVQVKLGDSKRALVSLSRAVRINPTAHTLQVRAAIYQSQRRMREALADLDRAIALAPRDSYSYYMRGLLYLKTNRFAPARADAGRLMALRPGSAYAKFLLGMVLIYDGGDVAAGRKLIEEAYATARSPVTKRLILQELKKHRSR